MKMFELPCSLLNCPKRPRPAPKAPLTADEPDKGTHFTGKKIMIEEAVCDPGWFTCRIRGVKDRTAELSQLLYHAVQVMMIANGLTLRGLDQAPVRETQMLRIAVPNKGSAIQRTAWNTLAEATATRQPFNPLAS